MSDPRIITAEEARALRGEATPGPWAVQEYPHEGEGSDAAVYQPDTMDCIVGASGTADARLIAAAPDLAATVEHLRAEPNALRAQRDMWRGLALDAAEAIRAHRLHETSQYVAALLRTMEQQRAAEPDPAPGVALTEVSRG